MRAPYVRELFKKDMEHYEFELLSDWLNRASQRYMNPSAVEFEVTDLGRNDQKLRCFRIKTSDNSSFVFKLSNENRDNENRDDIKTDSDCEL